MYLYGLDLAMETSGITIFDLKTVKPIYIGNIQTNDKHTHGVRLKYIEDKILELTEVFPPHVVSIERGFSRFPTSTQVIYRVHGVINKLFHNVEQVYYPPKKVKAAILKGTSTKKQVQAVILEEYPDVIFKDENESDSFAVALTHLIEKKLITWTRNVPPEKKPRKKKTT